MIKKIILILLTLILLTALGIGTAWLVWKFSARTSAGDEIYEEPEPRMEYGIVVDSLFVKKDRVKRNQSLSDILGMYGVGRKEIHELAQKAKLVFDVRKIREGNSFAFIFGQDSVPQPEYFIYEESPASYIVFTLKDPLSVHRGEKPIERILTEAGGTIESSLWNALADQGADPQLAITLSEVYAWTIDFFGIQKGDAYKVLYDELRVEGKPIGMGDVAAAYFRNYDKDFYAFYFEHKGQRGYYDERGQNLQRAFLKAPLQFKRISSRFSNSRMHPVLKIRRAHHGVDYAADHGTPVYSIGEGVVIEKGWDPRGGGNYLKIKHNSTYTTAYLHLSGFAKGIRSGVRVRQGELIGYVGSTGLSTGPHLDFRFYRNGRPIDPLKVESPPSEPVSADYMAAYRQLVDSLRPKLDSIRIN